MRNKQNAFQRIADVVFIIVFGCIVFSPFTVNAAIDRSDDVTEENKETGYIAVIHDEADLFSRREEDSLMDVMLEITEYGNAACITIDEEPFSVSGAGKTASKFYEKYFGGESGMLFLIDMKAREIYIECDGAVYQTITKRYAYTITDNVYRYASDGKYADCAENAFRQAADLLEGNRIAEPMKYICNALLAVITALLLNFGIVNWLSKTRKTPNKELIEHADRKMFYSIIVPDKTLSSEVIKMPSYGSVGFSAGGGYHGGGGHYGGGGHRSGGGHRGGGGGHRF